MPFATPGKNITSSNQLNADVVTDTQIAPNSVGNSEMKDDAIGTAEVTDGSIVNADINASAGIVDTKLAEIATADKVNGTSFKNLAGIPAGAGVIPSANIPTPSAVKLISTSYSQVNDADNSNEQVAYSFTLNGGELSTGNVLRVRVFISAATYNASAAPGQIYLKYASTVLQAATIPSGASSAPGYVDLFIIASGATNTQTSRALSHINTTLAHGSGATAAVDSTANQTVSICTKWNSSGWGQNITLDGYIAEIIK